MRLINVDTLDDYLGKWADDFYENPENSDADFMDGYCMTLNRIHSGAVPDVDAEPVRHGQWDYVTVVDEGFWRCSICGTPSEALGAKKLYKYCPFCGAKMDAEKEKTVVDINRKLIELAKEPGTNWFDRDEQEERNENN